jgi:hypothetical protein
MMQPRKNIATRLVFGALVLMETAFATGCGDDHTRTCSVSGDCVQGGVSGTCLPSPVSAKSWCAYPDPECASQLRWGLLAGDGLAKTCVESADAGVPDAADSDAAWPILQVTRSGAGGGAVVSAPMGIDCGIDCEERVQPGTQLILTATPEPGSTFIEWQGACTGAQSCQVTMDADKSVTAVFAAPADKLWLRSVGSADATCMAVDSENDVAIAGIFTGDMVDFGGGHVESAGVGTAAFVAKVSGATGATLWVTTFGSLGIGTVRDVVVDGTGDVVVVGSFTGTALSIGGTVLSSAGSEDVFIAKLSGNDGAILWAKKFGGTSIDRANDVDIGASGNIVVLGEFNGAVSIGTTDLTAMMSSFDVFIARFSGASGTPLWAKQMGGTMNDAAGALSVRDGFIAITGGHRGQFSGMPGFGDMDVFIGKFQEVDGSQVWLSLYGGSGSDIGNAIEIHSDGSVYVAGQVSGPMVTLGGAPFAAVLDIFVAKYSTSGNYLWSKAFGNSSSASDAANDIAVTAGGDVVVVGAFRGSVNFGGGALFASGMSPDIFLARLTGADGSHVWSRRFGGADIDIGSAVAVDSTGSVFTSGVILSQAEFFDVVLMGPAAWFMKTAP